MDGSPQRKKTRFSEYQQVFEYSSKGKKEADLDNDSLLLDTNEYDGNERKKENQIEEFENDSNFDCRLKIDEITSDLAAIEAYLQQESKPITHEPLRENPIQLTPEKDGKNKNPNQRFSLSIKPELLSGRETMSLEQEAKFKSTIKDLPCDTSNNKKRALNEQNKEKTLDERIENQIKNNKRITMDVKGLMNMLNDYKIDEEKKARDDRKNRITMDVFTLAKLIETTGEDENFEDDNKMQITPMKLGDKSVKKSKVFSAFKENPHPEDVRYFIGSYLNDVSRRLQEKQNENKRLTEMLSELKSESVKLDLKISDAKKRSSQRTIEKSHAENKVKFIQQELDKRKYEEDLSFIKYVESDLQLQVLKLDMTEEGCYGHFIFDELYLKIKSKTKNSPTDIKIMISQEAKNKCTDFIIGVDDAVKILKEYHDKIKEKSLHFVETVFTLRKAYQRILKLDKTLFYFSIDFELKDIVLNKNFDKLSFETSIGSANKLLIEIDLETYLTNEQNPRSISIYNHHKSEYINVNTSIKDENCVIFENMKKIVEAVI